MADDRHDPPPHDEHAREPLGPLTPDDETPLGDTPEAHDEITPHDLPVDHPGRQAAEELAGHGNVTAGNVESPAWMAKLKQLTSRLTGR